MRSRFSLGARAGHDWWSVYLNFARPGLLSWASWGALRNDRGSQHRSLRRDRGGGRPQRPLRRLLPRSRGPRDPRPRAARDRGRLLRDRGDRPRLPRLHHLLHREHAAARGHPRHGPRGARPAHGPLRSLPAGALPRRDRPAVVGGARAPGGRDRAALAAGRRDLVTSGRQAEAPRPLPPTLLPRAPAGPGSPRPRGAAGAPEDGPPLLGHLGPRDRGDGLLPHRQPRRVPRPQLRVGEGQDPHPRQQRLRQTRRALRQRHRPRPALPPAFGRRTRSAGLHGPRDGRHGRHHPGHGRGLPRRGGWRSAPRPRWPPSRRAAGA